MTKVAKLVSAALNLSSLSQTLASTIRWHLSDVFCFVFLENTASEKKSTQVYVPRRRSDGGYIA